MIDAALQEGVKAVIHVSSITALFDPSAQLLDENSPPGSASNAYGRSKVACEKYVRDLQAQGHPVHITYPATVIGPQDPGLTEAHVGMKSYLSGVVPSMPTGNQYVDVRDVAEAHRLLLEQAPKAGRYTLGGHYLAWAELGAALQEVTGRRFLSVPTSGAFMRGMGRFMDKLGDHAPSNVPMSEESMGYATQWVKMDNSKAEDELGLVFRPLAESLRDTIKWLYQAGHISSKQAGLLAEE